MEATQLLVRFEGAEVTTRRGRGGSREVPRDARPPWPEECDTCSRQSVRGTSCRQRWPQAWRKHDNLERNRTRETGCLTCPACRRRRLKQRGPSRAIGEILCSATQPGYPAKLRRNWRLMKRTLGFAMIAACISKEAGSDQVFRMMLPKPSRPTPIGCICTGHPCRTMPGKSSVVPGTTWVRSHVVTSRVEGLGGGRMTSRLRQQRPVIVRRM